MAARYISQLLAISGVIIFMIIPLYETSNSIATRISAIMRYDDHKYLL